MYENTNSSIDWKGIFLKVIIAFLVVAIAFTGIKTFTKSKVNKKPETTNVAESNLNVNSNVNVEKLLEAGKKYYTENATKLPKDEIKSIVTLNDLIKAGVITSITDADGKACDGESSYVTAEKSTNQNNENDYTIKANLVCGESYNNSSTYLGENASKVEISQNIDFDQNTGNNKKVVSSNTNNTCGTSCIPASTKITAENKVIFNKGDASTSSNNNNTVSNVNGVKKHYIVSFDGNNGTCNYKSYYVNEGEYASNPGSCNRKGYNFIGWTLDGREYNFNTPVTKDITLVANYRKDYGYFTDQDNNNYNYYRDQIETYVYSMAWHKYDIDALSVTHTLSIEDVLDQIEYSKNIYREDISKIRIKSLKYVEAIDTPGEAQDHKRYHASTFLNSASASLYPSNKITKSSLAYVSRAKIDTDSNYEFVRLSRAEREGFEVTWTTDRITNTCSSPFYLDFGYNNVQYDLCNYGIIYRVIWEFEYSY